MKKYVLIIGILFFVLMYNIQVSADEPIENLVIIGLDQLDTEFEAGINPDTIDFTTGLRLFENQGTLAPDKLMVDIGSVDFNRVGLYEVYYYVIFQINGEEARFDLATLPITIIDETKPTLHGIETIYIRQNEEINYLDDVYATDNDLSSPLDVKVFHHGVDITKTGIYTINYYVVDKSGNERTKQEYVVVTSELTDPNLPIITVDQDEFNLKQNQDNPSDIYMNAVSATDGELDLTQFVQLDDSNVDYTTLGNYHVIFMLFDRDGHFTSKKIPVNIVEDNEAPYFEGLGDVYELNINTSNLKQGIKAYDAVCGDVTDRINVTWSEFDFTTEGHYNVVYSVTDLNGNKFEKPVVVHVADFEAPVITAPSSLYLKLNETLDLAGRIKVNDLYDTDITYQLEDNNLDISKVGTYIISVTATDDAGNKASAQITIYVYDPDPKVFYENPIFIGAAVAIVVSGIITYIGYHTSNKKRRRRRY